MEPDTNSNQPKVIQASEILAKIERGEGFEYNGVIVEGNLDISGLDLPKMYIHRTLDEKGLGLSDELKVIRSQISIIKSEIRGNVNFNNVHFQERIGFEVAEFGNAHFDGAVFSKNSVFLGAKFIGNASFIGAVFGKGATFFEAKFSEDSFMEAVFCENARFDHATFGGEVWSGVLTFNSVFKGAVFDRNASFRDTKFIGDVSFDRAMFRGNTDFDHDQFSKDVTLNDAKFDQPATQEVACRIAKRKMEKQGNKEAADDYFYREMKAIRIQSGIRGTKKLSWPWKMHVSEWLNLVGPKIWRFGWYYISEYVLIQCIFGYGVHPLRLFVFWILMAVTFATFYWYFDAVEVARTWVDYLWFSIATSATPGYALYNPIGHYKIATGIQAIIGTFMWAAFIATFARKWQR